MLILYNQIYLAHLVLHTPQRLLNCWQAAPFTLYSLRQDCNFFLLGLFLVLTSSQSSICSGKKLIISGEFNSSRTYQLEWWYDTDFLPLEAKLMACVHASIRHPVSIKLLCTIPDGVHFNIVVPSKG